LTVEQNTERLKYLLKLFKISAVELLSIINENLKQPHTEAEIFAENIKLSTLKKIDKVFDKGLSYYLDPSTPKPTLESSIFFRKQNFSSELNLEAKKIVNHFEAQKIALSATAKLAEVDMKRKLLEYSVNHNAKEVALDVRSLLNPKFNKEPRQYLEILIGTLAAQNVLVFEFVETHNKKERANIDGFFLKPNVIVLKRQQQNLKREIFTLAHELGHALLNEEEIETLEENFNSDAKLPRIERWCNDFAFYFLLGSYESAFNKIENLSASNNYHQSLLIEISEKTHLSRTAILTRLSFDKKIGYPFYQRLVGEVNEEAINKRVEEKKKRELDKLNGKKAMGLPPKPINSPLFVSTLQLAYNQGIISEYELIKQLNIHPKNISRYIE